MSYDASSTSSNSPYGSKYSPYQNQNPYDKIYKKSTKEDRIQEAEKMAREAWEYGIVGIFTVGLLFGPWAIIKAIKARKMRANATAGFVTGALAIIANICVLGYVAFLFSI
jgi:hypothetical protein